MNIEKVLEQIKMELGINYEYDHFDEPPELPYITYERVETSNFYADGVVYYSVGRVDMLLHTSRRRRILEGKIQKILGESGIAWEKSTEWDEQEKIYTTTYTMEEHPQEDEK